jgi:hypothetical protein
MISTGYRCPLYDGDALPTDDPSQRDQPEDHPTRSANVTVPDGVMGEHDQDLDDVAEPYVAL